MQIWKHNIQPGPQTIQMPQGAELLHVATQGRLPTLWIKVDPDAPLVARSICVCCTGEDIEGEYVGTYQLDWFVGHVMDMGEK